VAVQELFAAEEVVVVTGALIVVAHPDDEVLGAGGVMARLASMGIPVDVYIACGHVEARTSRPSDAELVADVHASCDLLGVRRVVLGPFPNISMNTVPHLELVQAIETVMRETDPDVLITHHPADLNNDHLQVSLAAQAASRYAQRPLGLSSLRALYYMEVPSSTDWAFPGGLAAFQPDTFVELGAAALDAKISALRRYRGVMRPYPHPRSEEALRALATERGAQAGVVFAEAFQTAFRCLHMGDDF
jgi:LmbE family N-acetylglucosaminyl deacetylase